MSLIDDLQENTNIFNGYQRKIDLEAFDAFAEKHGEDVAKGYMKALHDFMSVVNNIVFKRDDDGKYNGTQPPSVIFNKMSHLHNALLDFSTNKSLPTDNLGKRLSVRSKIEIF